MKNTLETYTKTGELFKKTDLKDAFKRLDKTEMAENIFLLLLCRICFMGYLISPFGPAFFTALFIKRRKVSYLLVSAISILSLGNGAFTFKYGGIIIIISALTTIFSKEIREKRFVPSLICTGSVLLNGLVYAVTEGFFAYDILLLLLETASSYLAFIAFNKATDLIKTIEKRKVFEPFETVSFVVLCGASVLSVALMENLLPLAHILAILVILAISISCGFSISCPTGAVFGLCLGIASVYQAQTVCVYCLSSLASGFAKRYGKIGTAVTFAVSSFVITLLICPESNGIITVSYVALASFILIFIPDKILNRFGVSEIKRRKHVLAENRLREAVDEKMAETIRSIDSVNLVFRDVLESLLEKNGVSHGIIFDKCTDSVCKSCTLCKFCWGKNREDTISSMEEVYKIMERRDSVSKADIPQEFSSKCIRFDAFLSELNKSFESYKVTKMWAGRVIESKRLVAEQFNNISMILKNMKESLWEEMSFEPELEDKISAALDRRGVSAGKISVSSSDGFSVTMDKVSCGENLVCSTTVASALSEVLEVPMLREKRECQDDICHLKFSQQTRFATDIAISQMPMNNSKGSGDSALSFHIGNGKVAIILSDGMGSGDSAHFQSSIAIHLAKNLLCAGFDKETCVRLINNILMINADRDTFATIDLCIVNLYTGSMEFVKTGAANSYVKTSSENETIYASSLPAGLIEYLEPNYDLRYIKAGDYLIMASDGVTDILDTPECNEILKIADGFSGTAQELADNILNTAVSKSGGFATDDMTVAVCAVLENM